jgi:Zn-dependent protease with chaperone function
MDFFERQDKAHRHTKWLVVYFTAGVAALVVTVYLACLLVFAGFGLYSHRHGYYSYPYGQSSFQISWWNPQLFLGVAVGTLSVIALGSICKTIELHQGGSAVATMLGGELVNPHTTDQDERKLLNVVEEMAIAAGLPVPQVYLLRRERGINAFAAGYSTSDAVVSVTDGAMRLLTRDELQGVIGHEFSHILNGDTRLNLRLMGAIFGILCLTVVGRILLNTDTGYRRSRDRNPLPLLGLVLLVLGWVGVFFGRLIQAAVSRQREYLADASAVQFTRNPAGLAGALKKIGGFAYGSKMEAAHADEASHLFFGNGMGESFFHLWDTHPSLTERIKALEPDFDGRFPAVIEPAGPATVIAPLRDRGASLFGGMVRTAGTVAAFGMSGPPRIDARVALSGIGKPATVHLRYAEELRNSISPNLQAAAREAFGASALVYALLLSDDETARTKQLSELAAATSSGVCQEAQRLLGEVQALPTHAKLPLVDLALPGLRHLSPNQYKQFRAAVQALVESDGEIDLFEYVLQKVVLRNLEPQFVQARKPVIQYYALKPLIPDCAVLLSALAYVGQSEPAQVEAAFRQGAVQLSYISRVELALVSAEECELSKVDVALDRLAQSGPQIKKNVLNACAQTVAADGVILELEAELLRAIADSLDCPLPPFVTPAPEPQPAGV